MKEFDNFDRFKKYITDISSRIVRSKNSQPLRPDWKVNRYLPSGGFSIGIHEDFAIQFFYSFYCYDFSIEFLKSQAKLITDPLLKDWVDYCIDVIPDNIKYQNEIFEGQLIEWADRLGMSFETLQGIFSSYLPFITNYGYFRFAYNNLNSPQGKYFFVLLLMWLDGDNQMPESTDPGYNEKEAKEEVLEIQRTICESFVKQAPFAIKEEALLFLFDAFARINKLGIFEHKFSLSYDKVLYGGTKPLNGTFFVSWDNVSFHDGFYFIYHPSFPTGGAGHEPYRVEDANSRKSFKDIQKLFLKKLPPITVQSRNGKIKKVKNLANLSSCISVMEHKILVPAKKLQGHTLDIKAEKKLVEKSEAKNLVKELKSRYLDFLCARQFDNYKVVCCIENRVNSNLIVGCEYSFIFTIKETSSLIYLAFENATDSRCTYIFPILKSKWQESIDKIYEFFSSNEINKRQALSQRLAKISLPGNYAYKRVMHTNYFNWCDTIKYCNL